MDHGPILDERVAAIAPGFHAISIFVDARSGIEGSIGEDILATACDHVLAGEPAWAEAHLTSWNEAYLRFGAKPNRTPSSAQALRKRVLKEGRVPSINPVVDLYNAVSLRYAVPVGGENYDAYVGRPHLTISEGTEWFETTSSGQGIVESPAPGEVIWRDDRGVTCRRWNWRQGYRTRLDSLTGRMWFILEALETMPAEALGAASDMLANGLLRLMPDCEISRQHISFP